MGFARRLGLLTLLAAASWGALPASAAGLDLASARVVDLSWSYGEDTLYWPTSPSDFELTELAHGVTEGGWFYSANLLCTPEHGGTHLDAPIHFHDDVWTTAEIPVERFVRPAVVVDVSARASKNPDYTLTVADLDAWEAEHGPVPEGALVLLRTGWDERWPDRRAYLGDDTPGDASRLRFPSFGEAATRRLVERGAVGLGVDTASIDPGNSQDFPVHRVAAAANVFGLENLRALGELPATGAWVAALPMKIEGGSGGPARVVALVPPGAVGVAQGGGAPGEAAEVADLGLADLSWLAGCWAAKGRPAGSLEQWMAPAGGIMMGAARTVRQDQTSAFEFVMIRRGEDGELEYAARPSGQEGAVFRRVEQGRRHIVFANPEHDFPQRIAYRLEDGGRLHARIEGPSDDGTRGIDFPMRRVRCEGDGPATR